MIVKTGVEPRKNTESHGSGRTYEKKNEEDEDEEEDINGDLTADLHGFRVSPPICVNRQSVGLSKCKPLLL